MGVVNHITEPTINTKQTALDAYLARTAAIHAKLERQHKLLTDAGIRLGVVVSDLHGQSAVPGLGFSYRITAQNHANTGALGDKKAPTENGWGLVSGGPTRT